MGIAGRAVFTLAPGAGCMTDTLGAPVSTQNSLWSEATFPARSAISTDRTWRPSARPSSHCVASAGPRSEEHTSELQSRQYLVCRLLLEKKKNRCQVYHDNLM